MVTSLQVPYADVRAADLRWSDASAALPALESLEVDVAGGGILRLTIVGCSHQVLADTPWVRLTETVARLPEGGIPLAAAAGRRPAGDAAYRFGAQVDRHDPDAFADAVDGLLAGLDDTRPTVVGRFPGRPGAVTALRCDRADAEALVWRTWHTYPGTGEVVATRSELRRA